MARGKGERAMGNTISEVHATTSAESLPHAANCFYGKTPIDWMEWQANRAAPRIRMPARIAEDSK